MAANSFKDDEKMDSAGKHKVIMRLLSYLKPYKKTIILVLLTMGITIAINLSAPLIVEYAIDNCLTLETYHRLFVIGGIVLVMGILYVVLVKIRMYLMAKLSNNILLSIRQEVFDHIQKLSFSFFDTKPTGKILSRIIGDVNSLKDVLGNAVTTLIPEFVTVVCVLVIMFIKNARLALAALCTLPFMIVAMFFIEHFAHKRWQIFRKKASNMNAYLHEDIAGIRVVQSLAAEEETKSQFGELADAHCKSFIDACRIADFFGSVIDFSWGIAIMVLYLVGVRFMGAPIVSVGLLVAFGTYTGMFWQPIMNLSNFYNQLNTNLSAAERVFDVLDTKPEIEDSKDAVTLSQIDGSVTFDHVSFSYPDEEDPVHNRVLEDVSFHIDPGETIALAGPTGAGKTTIVSLLSRFYDVSEGSVEIDHMDIRNVTMQSLRSRMGIMTQDSFIFQGTIKDNILYGKPDATDEEVIAAAKAVCAHDFIMKMDKGYDTELQEQGAGLSAGQKQLLAFARTLLSDPAILILDEATSSIDTNTEILIQQGINALLKGRTSFVIAHRLSTIQNADRIFVVDQKGILEQGSPKQLMAQKGLYYNLYKAQFAAIE